MTESSQTEKPAEDPGSGVFGYFKEHKALSVIAGFLVVVLSVLLIDTLRSADECELEQPGLALEAELDDGEYTLAIPENAELSLRFGTDRSRKDDSIPSDAFIKIPPGAPESTIPLSVRSPERGDASVEGVVAWAEVHNESHYQVKACVTPGKATPGKYVGAVEFPPEFDAAMIPITVTVQSRWVGVVGVTVAFFAVVFGVYISGVPTSREYPFSEAIAATTAVLGLYASTVVDNDTFGTGNSEALAYALWFLVAVAAATGAATGVKASVKAGKSAKEKHAESRQGSDSAPADTDPD